VVYLIALLRGVVSEIGEIGDYVDFVREIFAETSGVDGHRFVPSALLVEIGLVFAVIDENLVDAVEAMLDLGELLLEDGEVALVEIKGAGVEGKGFG
jgi:hypothetical protein